MPVGVCVLVSTKAIEGLASQISLAVTIAATGIVLQLAVASAGTPTNTGAVISNTVTVKLQLAVLHELVAVIVTVVTPLLKVRPLPVPMPLPVVAPENT